MASPNRYCMPRKKITRPIHRTTAPRNTPTVSTCPARVVVGIRICGPCHTMAQATATTVSSQVTAKLVRLRARKPSALNAISITSAWNASCGAATSKPSTPRIDTPWCTTNKPGSLQVWHQPLA